jgi:DNA-binding transcriptional ArsR family regulator
MQLGAILDGATTTARPTGRWREPRRYRSGSIFANDEAIRAPLDRNQRAKLIALAESLEARTRRPGRQNGAISRIGLMVLRALLFRFLGPDGKCSPNYDAIRRATGLSRQSVSAAIGRLERVGLLRIVRRIVRRQIVRTSPITGGPESYVGIVQCSNAYVITSALGGASLCAPPGTNRAEFPLRKQGVLATILAAAKPSLRDRGYPLNSNSTLVK